MPFQLERILLFGLLTCVVSLTSVLVVLPLRATLDAVKTMRAVLSTARGEGGVHRGPQVDAEDTCWNFVHIYNAFNGYLPKNREGQHSWGGGF